MRITIVEGVVFIFALIVILPNPFFREYCSVIAGIGKSLKSLPRIISVSRRETSLMDYKRPDWIDGRSMSEFSSLMTDYEIKLLVVWALISPLAALAFVIWTKYDKLKWIALPLFVVSIFQFIGQWGGFIWIFERFFRP